MSSMPGIDTGAPERTESSRGSSSAPNLIGVFLEASDSGVDLIVQTRVESCRSA